MKYFLIIGTLLFFNAHCFGQVLSNNGAVANILSGTVISGGSLENTAGTFTNAGTITLSSTLNNAATLNGNGNINLAGNWINTGTFTSGSGTVTFNGSGIQSITGSTSFTNFTLNNSSGLTLGNNLTITGALILSNGAVTIGSNTLTLNGAVSGGGTLGGSSTSNLVLGGTTGTINFGSGFRILKNLTLNTGATATLGTPLEIVAGAASGTVIVNSGATLTTGGNLTLKSNSTGTARIGSSAGTISGNATVERYIQGRRKYRLITSSVTTSASATLTSGQEGLSIWGNWQTSGTNTAGLGNIITGGSAADGFDQQTGTPSMFTYDDANRNYVAFSSANGKNTKYTPLKAGIPYYMFVYGDRVNSIITSTPNNTTLSSTGTLLLGDQTYNSGSAIPLSNVTGRYTMMGNPFASPIDWGSVVKTNIAATYWGWDPNLSSTGGYVTVTTTGTATLISPYSGTTGLNQYIQPGQGFFVQTTAASPQLVIREQDKASTFNASAFRTRSANDLPLIAMNLLYDNAGTKVLSDGVLAAFDNTFSGNVGKEDALKMTNAAENISIVNGSELLSIDARPLPQLNDTLFLNVLRLKRPKYTLQIFAQQMNTHNVGPYLEDTYLGTSLELSVTDTNHVEFSVDVAKAASFDPKRFRIVYRPREVSPVTYISLTATPKEKDAVIEWKVKEDNTIEKYSIEHSVDNILFTKKAETIAKAQSNIELYKWIDLNASAGINYYRIRSIHTGGKTFLSKTIAVKIEQPAGGIKVFPNPVKNKLINLQLNNLEKGQYKLLLLNSNGITVFSKTIDHSGGSASLSLYINNLFSGIHYLRLMNDKASYSQTVLSD